ncbi:MAG: hypothetical protein ACK5UY_04155 [Holosporales bacterium]
MTNLHKGTEKDNILLSDLRPGHIVRAMANTLRQIIAHTASKEYLLNFSNIDPHGLSKICHTLLISFEEMQECEGAGKPFLINEDVMIEGLIDCMRRIRIELAADRIAEVSTIVEHEYRETGTPAPVVGQTDSIYKFRQRRAVND